MSGRPDYIETWVKVKAQAHGGNHASTGFVEDWQNGIVRPTYRLPWAYPPSEVQTGRKLFDSEGSANAYVMALLDLVVRTITAKPATGPTNSAAVGIRDLLNLMASFKSPVLILQNEDMTDFWYHIYCSQVWDNAHPMSFGTTEGGWGVQCSIKSVNNDEYRFEITCDQEEEEEDDDEPVVAMQESKERNDIMEALVKAAAVKAGENPDFNEFVYSCVRFSYTFHPYTHPAPPDEEAAWVDSPGYSYFEEDSGKVVAVPPDLTI